MRKGVDFPAWQHGPDLRYSHRAMSVVVSRVLAALQVQQEKELLQSARRGGIALREDAGQAFTSSAAGMGVRERDGPNMVGYLHTLHSLCRVSHLTAAL